MQTGYRSRVARSEERISIQEWMQCVRGSCGVHKERVERSRTLFMNIKSRKLILLVRKIMNFRLPPPAKNN